MPVLRVVICALLLTAAATPLAARQVIAQAAPVVETIVPFDSAGRVMLMTPMLVSRLKLAPSVWPVTDGFRDARLLRSNDSRFVLSVQRNDGAFARYALDHEALSALQFAMNAALDAQAQKGERFVGTGTGLDVSQPAGNSFVRNQVLLGLTAYGPASAALFSKSGSAAAGAAYFLAAGTSFFIAAKTARALSVTRAQASLAAHGGTRGAITGLGIAAIANADGGPAWGAPVLAGAIGGTIAGFRHARGLTDGEAASAGLLADLAALTAIGIGGTTGAFEGREYQEPYNPQFPNAGSYTRSDNSLRGGGKAVIGTAIGAQLLGYAYGPRYARRAAYNVTAGDASMVFTSAVIGGAAFSAFTGKDPDGPVLFGAATAGVLAGAWFGDRVFARFADRTTADGTLARLGALAGGLIGAGIAAAGDASSPVAIGVSSAGALVGLLAADGINTPAKDAGPLRGMSSSSRMRAGDERVSLTLGPVSMVRVTF